MDQTAGRVAARLPGLREVASNHRRLALCVSFTAIALLTLSPTAMAHDPALSGIRVLFQPSGVVISVTTHISRLMRAEGAGTPDRLRLSAALGRRLRLRLDGVVPSLQPSGLIWDAANDLIICQSRCDHPAVRCEVLSRLYPEDDSSRTVVSIVQNGEPVQDVVLDGSHPDLLGSQAHASRFEVAGRYLNQGVGHIFGGADHILFVVGLLLMGGTLKSLIKTVSAFTLAHSITLTLAATGVWNPGPRIIEPLIALSIVAIAAENIRRAGDAQGRDLRPWFAFGFGLIHGFGFAGALAEVGLPRESLAVALASFNAGVEVGQVTIVLAVAPALALLARRKPAIRRSLLLAGSAAIGLCGMCWFVSRVGLV